MIAKTLGIVICQIKYSDTARIVDIYTAEYGKVSYMVRGVSSSKKSRLRSVFFQPLTLVELVTDHQNKREVQYLRDARLTTPLHYIYTQPVKNALTAFVAEVLKKTLRYAEKDERLFDFLTTSVLTLEKLEEGMGNFHLIFLARLSYYLGFAPSFENSDTALYFDLENGVFESLCPSHRHYLVGQSKMDFLATMQHDYTDMRDVALNRQQRAELLDAYCTFYQLHLPNFGTLRSLDVLHQLFD